ncbi:hypothetical protein T05_6942 [Trichinella murrelli]|uniref:Uncharacterized protein n=1 Tax=Trichinella murrelli TaxID=144512 RepID=A0A0V0TYI8_9BILA|nr:hypothetical protein T05_6942 [Trichinella murrelli]
MFHSLTSSFALHAKDIVLVNGSKNFKYYRIMLENFTSCLKLVTVEQVSKEQRRGQNHETVKW